MLKCSHVLCKVEDLAEGVDAWREAGFDVQWGSDPDGAVNALIWFEAGPFIELIDAKRVQPSEDFRPHAPAGMLARFDRWLAAPEGWCDLCLEAEDDISPYLPKFQAAGIEAFGPIVGHRQPPDGEKIRTQTCFPLDPALPFFMGAYVPDARPRQVVHPNGATSIGAIHLTAPADREHQYRTLLGYGDREAEGEGEGAVKSDSWAHRSVGDYGIHTVTLAGLSAPIDPASVTQAVLNRQ